MKTKPAQSIIEAFTRYTACLAIMSMTACSSMQPKDFTDVTPQMTFERYFSGDTKGQGMFYGRSDNVAVRFVALFHGDWDGKALTLHENLTYDSGEKINRTYTFSKIDDHLYDLTCEECVGKGSVESFGNSLLWKYSIRQKIDGSDWTLNLQNWMFLQQDGLVLSREYVRKFGLTVGQVFMGIQKKIE